MPSLIDDQDALQGKIFDRLFSKLKGQERLDAVPRYEKMSVQEFFIGVASKGLPAILGGLVPKLAQQKSYTLSVLREAIGSLEVEARFGNYANPEKYVKERQLRKLPLSKLLDDLEGEKASVDLQYLGNNTFPAEAFALLKIESPYFYPIQDFNPPRVWLGPTGAITPLHKDIVDNFCLHIFGRKRWIIYPVRDYPYLYMSHPDPAGIPDFATSSVDVRNPDYSKFPDFKRARGMEIDISPGETLYLPAGWAHYVETLEPSLMVNYWVKRHRSPAFLEGSQ